MSEPNDLSPLFDDPSIGSLLRDAAASHDPSPADLAGLTKKLAGVLPPPPGGGGGAAPAAATGGAAKLVAALGVIALVGAGAYVAGGEKKDDPVVRPALTASTVVSAEPVVPVALEPLPVESAVPTTSASTVVAPPPAPPSEPEGTMLARAHDALLHGAPDRALAIANDHAKAYPQGALAQERDMIAIEALVAAGRKPEAQRRAAAFKTSYPGSSHQERIDRLVSP